VRKSRIISTVSQKSHRTWQFTRQVWCLCEEWLRGKTFEQVVYKNTLNVLNILKCIRPYDCYTCPRTVGIKDAISSNKRKIKVHKISGIVKLHCIHSQEDS
jgi:hypothetical protein